MTTEKVRVEFERTYSETPRLFKAPGRINLIGDHTDYNDGLALPGAINRYSYTGLTLSKSEYLQVKSRDLNENLKIKLSDLNPIGVSGWRNYFIGVAGIFQQRGVEIPGINCVFSSDVPSGAGLSSSAAITCSFAMGLNELCGQPFERAELVDIAQETEHDFANVQCGTLDQTASLFGKKERLLQLDFSSGRFDYHWLNLQDHVLLVVDTKVSHSLADSAYNTRKEECLEGIRLIQNSYSHVKGLRDVDLSLLASCKLPGVIIDRCSFVLKENERVTSSVKAIAEGDLNELGKLMCQSHDGLKNEYQVSCAELDLIVEESKKLSVVKGARLMGGGFGGSCIVLIQSSGVKDFKKTLTNSFNARFGHNPDFFEFRLVDGACEVFI